MMVRLSPLGSNEILFVISRSTSLTFAYANQSVGYIGGKCENGWPERSLRGGKKTWNNHFTDARDDLRHTIPLD